MCVFWFFLYFCVHLLIDVKRKYSFDLSTFSRDVTEEDRREHKEIENDRTEVGALFSLNNDSLKVRQAFINYIQDKQTS